MACVAPADVHNVPLESCGKRALMAHGMLAGPSVTWGRLVPRFSTVGDSNLECRVLNLRVGCRLSVCV